MERTVKILRRGSAAAHLLLLVGLLAVTGCGSRGSRPTDAGRVEPTDAPLGWDAGADDAGVAIASAARARLGAPYRYGGTRPSGYDCSGLVQTIYRDHGIALPRTVRDQVHVGTPVPTLVPGDLVFFRLDGGGASHVGIYVGGGEFVHASSGRRQVVVESLEHNEYFREHYLGARRILPLD